ncbi:MAG: cation-translocating P-type ATPase [Vicinamibacterales bacterium]
MSNTTPAGRAPGSSTPARDPRLEVDSPWSRPWQDVVAALGVTRERGLAASEAAHRRRRVGRNRLREPHHTSVWQVLANQFKSVILLLLGLAAAVSLALGDWIEGGAIVAVIGINAAIGFATEWQAVRSMEALRRLERLSARVRRDSEVREVPADDLVPGDVVVLDGGDIVTADLRLVDASKLQVDESLLTGESLPVAKRPDPLDVATTVAGRANMLFKGTLVTRGSGEAVVVATGMRTELGTIAALTEEAEEASTPLERRLERLGQRLIWVTLAIAAAVTVAGVLAGRALGVMLETSIALAVAAIPEGLPIVATLALARGMLRMARRNAVVQRLAAVETLGATSVICTDKTGTLTENRLTVTRLWLSSGLVEIQADGTAVREGRPLTDDESRMLKDLLAVGVLCNNAALHSDGTAVGDPLEVALLRAGANAGLHRAALVKQVPEVREEAFDAATKMMATVHRTGAGRYRVAVKGAPEAVLGASVLTSTDGGDRALDPTTRKAWQERVDRLADEGLRLLAHADKLVDDPGARPYEGLRLLGLVGFVDPPRGDAAGAIEACQRAGIQVVMVTGDQALTARSIARAVHLVQNDEHEVFQGGDIERVRESPDALSRSRIFARVAPKQKLDLIDAFQKSGHVVAMTGDGVNDAPALKKADIGVAMGRRGTQVAREAADMVLEDDAFATIVAAVRQGRVIFDNIRRFVMYLLSCNISEIFLVASASVTSAPLPILPLQILFLNLVTDVFPALALGLGEGGDEVMTRPPRRAAEQILSRDHWIEMALWAGLITGAVLAAFWMALDRLGMDEARAVTVSFLTLAFAQLWHVFNMRGRGSGLFRNDVVANPWIWGALALCTALLLAAVFLPPLSAVLRVEAPSAREWLLIAGMSLVPVVAGPAIRRHRP